MSENSDGEPPKDDDDKGGYGKPPKEHRFRKGKSGNPKGRPRKKPKSEDELPTGLTNWRDLLLEEVWLSIGVQTGPTIGAQKGTTWRHDAGLMLGADLALALA